MQSRLTHILTLLGTALTAGLPILLDSTQPGPAKVALLLVTLALLFVKTDKLGTYRNAILGGLAGVGVVVAAIIGKFSPGSAGLAVGSFVLAVITQLRIILPQKLPPAAVVALLAGLGVLALAPPVRADGLVLDLSPAISCSPVGMLTGYQYNVKTGDFQKGVALGAGYGCRYTGWKVPLGLNLVGGAAVNQNAPNAGQGSLIFVVNDAYGFGPGAQVFKDPVTGSLTGQMLLSLFLTPSWGATRDQLRAVRQNAAAGRQ